MAIARLLRVSSASPAAGRARRWTRALLLLAALGGPRRALAEAPRWSLEWHAPEGCATEAEIRDGVANLLGAPPEAATGEKLVVVAAVQDTGSGYRLRLSATKAGSTGERVIEVTSCSEAIRTATLLIALAIDRSFGGAVEPGAAADPAEAGAAFPLPLVEAGVAAQPPLDADAGIVAPPAAARAKQLEVPPGERESPPRPASRRSGRETPPRQVGAARASAAPRRPGAIAGEVGATGRLSVGDTPRAAAGAAIGGALLLRRNSVRLFVGGSPVQRRSLAGESEGYAAFYGVDSAVTLCHDLLPHDVRLGPCVGARAALLRGVGREIEERDGTTVLLLGPSLGFAGSIGIGGPLRLTAEAQAHWLPWRPTFVVNQENAVHRPNPVGAVLGLGATLDLD